MLPTSPSGDCTPSERAVFEIVGSSDNSSDYFCLHSVGLARHERKEYAQADFVVVGPPGVFCLEAKGGNVSREDGVWTIGWPDSQYTSTEGPFKQSEGTRWPLIDELSKRLGTNIRNYALVGWGVMFPDIIFDQTDPEWDLDQVYDQRDKRRDFVGFVEQLARYTADRRRETGQFVPNRLGPSRIREIVNCLRGDFEVVVSTTGLISDSEQELIDLSEDQFRLWNVILSSDNPRILCDGGAGTGKTLLAVNAARILSEDGLGVCFLCFNRNLSLQLQREAIGSASKFDVSTLHQMLERVIQQGGGKELLADARRSSNDEEYFEHRVPDLFSDSVIRLLEDDAFKQYDVLILDEAQDVLSTQLMNCISDLLVGGIVDGRWLIFYDSGVQSTVFERLNPDVLKHLREQGPTTIHLTDNYRNPPRIIAEMCQLLALQPPVCRRNLRSNVEYGSYDRSEQQGRKLRTTLMELIREGVPASSITVLSPLRKEAACINEHPPEVGKVVIYLDKLSAWPSDVDAITAASISSFKGLENEVIVLTDLDQPRKGSAWANAMIYVGMTRARTRLIALVDQDFIDFRVSLSGGARDG